MQSPCLSERSAERTEDMKRTVASAIRTVQTAAENPRLTKFSLHAPKSVEVEFDNGNTYNLSAEYLRVYSPAVDSKIRSISGEKSCVILGDELNVFPFPLNSIRINLILDQVITGRRHVGIMSAEPVGNYGMRILFDDLHKTGIFTWDYFYHLGNNKFSLMRSYIQTLKKHGLSRDPPRKK